MASLAFIAFLHLPVVGLSLALAASIALRNRRGRSYNSAEKRALKIDEAFTVRKFGLLLVKIAIAFAAAVWIIGIIATEMETAP